jgi:hypothetical protein
MEQWTNIQLLQSLQPLQPLHPRKKTKVYIAARRPKPARRRQPFPPIYTPPSADEQLRARQCFFGRDIKSAPAKNTIRFLDVFTCTPSPSWISNILYSQDKSLTEWHTLLLNYKSCRDAFPFISEHINMLNETVMKQLQIRACVRNFIRKLRARIAERRVIGEIDLYTTTCVPKNAQVRIYDIPNKSVYVFHTQTAVRILLSGLQHSVFGIPSPHMPKNPYTNIPFTLPQIMVILEQILINSAHAHHLPNARIFQFRQCIYNIDIFIKTFRHHLNIESARTFLHSFHDPTSIGYYMEVLDDTIETEILDIPKWSIIYKYIENRTLPPDIMKRFDTVVLCLFLFQNHSICYTFKSYNNMLNEVVSAYRAAFQWIQPRTIVRRQLGPSAFGSDAPQVSSQILQHV